jgi:hypothetical protein
MTLISAGDQRPLKLTMFAEVGKFEIGARELGESNFKSFERTVRSYAKVLEGPNSFW